MILMMMLAAACTITQGSGVPATQEYDLGEYSALDNSTQVEVTWARGDTALAALTCDDNLLDVYEVGVDGGTLFIKSPNGVLAQPQTECVLELEGPCITDIRLSASGRFTGLADGCDVRQIRASGSGGVRLEEVSATAVEVDLSASGGVTLEGAADALDLRVSGSGGLDAEALEVRRADVNISSSGTSRVAVTDRLSAKLSGSGDLHVYGAPSVESLKETASGEVIFH